ncbi:MAG: hypothetical protein U1D30_05975 [Planctomycetota bacterium]
MSVGAPGQSKMESRMRTFLRPFHHDGARVTLSVVESAVTNEEIVDGNGVDAAVDDAGRLGSFGYVEVTSIEDQLPGLREFGAVKGTEVHE